MTTEDVARLRDAAPRLLAACKAFVALFQDSDMRPEDECHEIYRLCKEAITEATGNKP